MKKIGRVLVGLGLLIGRILLAVDEMWKDSLTDADEWREGGGIINDTQEDEQVGHPHPAWIQWCCTGSAGLCPFNFALAWSSMFPLFTLPGSRHDC